jgi:acyl-coenzyme A thioesterase PaaI-like protein
LTVDFLRAARGVDLRARARVVRRGRQLCFCDVEVIRPDEELVAKGLVTYKIG